MARTPSVTDETSTWSRYIRISTWRGPSRSTEITWVEMGWDMAVGFFFPLCHFFISFLTVPWMLTFLAAAKHKT